MLLDEVLMSGNLKKKAKMFGKMQEVFCEMRDDEFVQYKSGSKKNIEQTIKANQISDVKLVDGNNKQFSMETKSGSIVFEADSRHDAYDWVVAIKSCLSMDNSLSMDDFYIISVLGRGFYGKVMLVQKKGTNKFYAIKSIHKSRLVENDKLHTVLWEKEILSRISHPFIVKIAFAFQNSSKFYLGLEYIEGGEIYGLLQKHGRFPIDQARLYAAEIGLALDYLHKNNIVYRDLKPENVILDEDGHIKLIDFGLAEDIGITRKSSEVCGTSEYLAPEIIKHEDYSFGVDWWSFGVLVYEMIFGGTPFYSDNKSAMYDRICEEVPIFPDGADPTVVDFVSQLLEKDASKRPDFDKLRNHPFWAGLDFAKVLNREIKPEFIPENQEEPIPTNVPLEFQMEAPADSFASPVFAPSVDGFSFVGTMFDESHFSGIPQFIDIM